jgi:ferredoxin, 2Fe-2S
MPTLLFETHDGRQQAAPAKIGESVMRAAVNAGSSGLLADCGGEGNCGTCHGYIDAAWFDTLPLPKPNEKQLLEYVVDPKPHSRLTCQIQVTAEMESMVVRFPKSQV